MPENRKLKEIRPLPPIPWPWVDSIWRVAASRWAAVALLGAWMLLLLICALVPQEGVVLAGDGWGATRWVAALQARHPLLGGVAGGLGLARIWQGWAVRALQGLTVAWLVLRWAGELLGWLGPEERVSHERRSETDWETTVRETERVAVAEGWRLVRLDEDVAVVWAIHPAALWRRALVSLVWVALLMMAGATWVAVVTPERGVKLALALGEETRVGRWGIGDLRLDRLRFWPRPDGTTQGLAGDLSVSLQDGGAHEVQVAAGWATKLSEAVLRVVAVGPALRVEARSPGGEAASLSPMAGAEEARSVLRVQLGGIDQEHLMALEEGQAVLRLVEGVTSLSGEWAVLAELLDGRTGELMAREALQAPGVITGGGWEVELRPEFYVRLSVASRAQPIARAADVVRIMGLALACIGLAARWRWRPRAAALVLSPAGQGSRCVLLTSRYWQDDLIAKLAWDGGEEAF